MRRIAKLFLPAIIVFLIAEPAFSCPWCGFCIRTNSLFVSFFSCVLLFSPVFLILSKMNADFHPRAGKRLFIVAAISWLSIYIYLQVFQSLFSFETGLVPSGRSVFGMDEIGMGIQGAIFIFLFLFCSIRLRTLWKDFGFASFTFSFITYIIPCHWIATCSLYFIPFNIPPVWIGNQMPKEMQLAVLVWGLFFLVSIAVAILLALLSLNEKRRETICRVLGVLCIVVSGLDWAFVIIGLTMGLTLILLRSLTSE